MTVAEWSCECGATRAGIDLGDGSRLVCYCDDCQAFLRALGAEDRLDPAGGTDLFQTTPDRIEVTAGKENLACLRLTDKGPLRWSASCCDAPFANSLTTRQVPFVSVHVSGIAARDTLGEVVARVNRKFATARVEGRKGALGPIVWAILRRAATARLTRRHRDTPFFDDKGRPVAEVRRLTDAERRAAYRAFDHRG